MDTRRRGGRPNRNSYRLAAALIATGTAMVGVGLVRDRTDPPPQPPTPDLAQPAPRSPAPAPEIAFPPSVPKRIKIPSIKVNAPVRPVETQRDGTLGVPPLSRVREVGWWEDGPTPGENGNSVLVGHVDSKTGPGAFYSLGALRPGRRIEVVRGDGTVPAFRIERVRRVDKDKFPTDSVYGQRGGPELRLITCGGRFDRKRGHYLDNVIVYATLIPGSRNAVPGTRRNS
ncbi:class F sortase [Actinomadura sp. WMMA1423]|uniref:class F sortase n=1 Tax=Actinomadura sp. WMMA1423 TaxID=2591108 RepID=UPI0011461AF4|nr:class F sortase [Actinomadura sp. WMMA1423]